MGQGVVEIDGAEKHTDFFTEEGCFHSRRTGVLRPATRHVYGSPSQSAHRSHAVANSQDLKLHLTPRIHSHARLHLHIPPFHPHNTYTPCPTAAYSEEVVADGEAAIAAEEREEVAAAEVVVELMVVAMAELLQPKRSGQRRRISWI
jgi:hypothetical protein